MKRRKGKDSNGEYEDIALKWNSEKECYEEVGFDDPEFKKYQSESYAKTKVRKKKRSGV